MEEINFKGTEPKPEGAYRPYVPETVKMLSITQGFSLPLLSAEAGGPSPAAAVYRINDGMLTLRVELKITSEDGANSVTTPLAMCKYVKPDGDNIYNADMCRDATFANLAREAHNGFIVKVMNAFMEANDVGTSSQKMTCPAAPADANKLRLEAIKALTSDKLGTTKKAVKYLSTLGIYCGRDYEFDDAFETANEASFKETCKKRAAHGRNGRIRIQLEGCPPSSWDGLSETDSAGHYVAWARGAGHTFLTPCVTVVRIPDPPAPALAAIAAGEVDHQKLLEETARPESFDDLVLKPQSSATLKALPPPPSGPAPAGAPLPDRR